MKKFLKFLLFGFLGLLVLGIIAAAFSDDESQVGKKVDDTTTVTAEGESSTKTEVEKYKIGDTVELEDGLQIKLNKVRKDKGDGLFKPKEDMYLYVSVTLENKGSKSQHISSLANFELADPEGIRYNITIAPDSKGKVDGEIAPGQKLKGELAFDVAEADYYELIHKEVFANGQVIWKFDKSEIE